MFSLDRFYNILHDNLISQFTNGKSIYFYPFGTYQDRNVLGNGVDVLDKNVIPYDPTWIAQKTWMHCYFADQEPYYDYTLPIIQKSILPPAHFVGPNRINILANSEHSILKNNFVKSNNYYDWYYFFHGFAALDWYRDFQYVNPSSFNRFDKVFMCYNHLTSKLRSYRLHLVSNLIEQDLIKQGSVSLFHTGWQQTIEDPENPLDSRARIKIFQALKDVDQPLTADTTEPSGSLSASVKLDNLTSALFHVVTETVYFQDKLHLTEKVFKPIVARRPFILASTPGSLAYLKSYGFQTFDRWIDESYDLETDHYLRIEMITAEIKKLCNMDRNKLLELHRSMQQVLDYNFNHFYGNFKKILVNELVDNFSKILSQINHGRLPGNHSRYHYRFELDNKYMDQVKQRLLQ